MFMASTGFSYMSILFENFDMSYFHISVIAKLGHPEHINTFEIKLELIVFSTIFCKKFVFNS